MTISKTEAGVTDAASPVTVANVDGRSKEARAARRAAKADQDAKRADEARIQTKFIEPRVSPEISAAQHAVEVATAARNSVRRKLEGGGNDYVNAEDLERCERGIFEANMNLNRLLTKPPEFH